MKKTADWVKDKWNTLCETVSKTADIIFTEEFVRNIDDIILSNIVADAGICVEMGVEIDIGGAHI